MADVSRRLRMLLDGPTPRGEAARMLIAMLDYAEEGERDALALAAVETVRTEAIAAVFRRLHSFGPRVGEALSQSSGLDAALSRVIEEGRSRATSNVVHLVAATADPALLHHLIRLLDSDCESRPDDEVGGAFLAVIVSNIGERGRRIVAPGRACHIDGAIVAALETYPKHRNRRCLLAAALACARPGPELAAILDDPRSPAALVLRSAVRDLDEPIVRRNLVDWLGVPGLAGQAQRWMHRLRGPEQFSDLLAHGHLLRDPGRRSTLRRVDRPKRCLPPAAVAAQMTPESQRWLPDLIGSLGLPTAQRIEHLRDAIALPSDLARLRAACDLAALASTDADAWRALEHFCFDRDGSVARTAVRHLVCPSPHADAEFLLRLVETNRPEIVSRVRLRLAPRSANDFFEHWLQLPEPSRLAAAHRLIVRERDTFVRLLRERIALSPREERLAAIGLARRLRVVEHVAEAILVQTASTDARIASAAVACLVHVQHPRRHEAARTALRHADARVRANAVESIAAFDEPPLIELVAPLMTSRENRVRANAIRAVIERKPERAEANLRSMLRDANALHRVSGLWVARRSRASVLLDELAAIAVADPLEPVRERATVARRSILLETSLRP